MQYNSSITDFFKSPKWMMNMLLGAVCILIPVIGPLVLGGWLVTCLWERRNNENPADYPPLDFQYFSRYIELGLWPFVVNLVASLVIFPVVMIMLLPIVALPSTIGHRHGAGQDIAFGMFLAVAIGLQFLLSFAYQIVSTPLIIRAIITQDFKSSFHLGFVKDFISRVWKEQLVILVFMIGVSLCMMIIMAITCFIGIYFTVPLMMFSWYHLQKQLYQIYLSRGGEQVPMSPKLQSVPPPFPAA